MLKSPGVIVETPTTWPASLMSRAWLVSPPSVGNSVRTPWSQRKARDRPAALTKVPTTWPDDEVNEIAVERTPFT